jgi:hypothetical protein
MISFFCPVTSSLLGQNIPLSSLFSDFPACRMSLDELLHKQPMGQCQGKGVGLQVQILQSKYDIHSLFHITCNLAKPSLQP